MSEPSFSRPPANPSANPPDRPPADTTTKATAEGNAVAPPEAAPQATPAATPEATPETTLEATIDVTVNGESRRIAAGATVAALLAELGLADRRVAVERNREVVPRAEHARAVLAAGDHLEVVTFVGGG